LIFISGVFIPIGELPPWGVAISSFSPLTYFTDLARHSIQGTGYYPVALDLAALLAFSAVFLMAGIKLHERTLPKRLQ
jgi:ABC-2 type transport system permease protein